MLKYIFDTGPWFVRVPAWFISGAVGVSLLLMVVIYIIAIAISMGWWGWLFVIAIAFGVILAICVEIHRQEELAKKTKQSR